MARKSMLAALALSAALLSGCASWTPVPYIPNPAAVSDPAEDFQRLVMMAKVWRPASIQMNPTFAALLYAGPYGVQTVTIPFNEVTTIEVLSKGEDFLLRAKDASGKKIYEYVATNQKNAQDLADVFAALCKANPPK